MALKNPLAYYTPGIPGRGAGTILKQPDLSGYAARQMKLTDAKLKQKDDEDKKALDEFEKLAQIKGTYSHIIHDEADKEMADFDAWALGVISKGGGKITPYDMQEARIKTKHAENTFAQSLRAESDYEKAQTIITSDYAKGTYDANGLANIRTKIEDEIKKPLKEQNIFSIIAAEPRFDLNKYEKEVINPNIASKATIGGYIGAIQQDPTGIKYARGEKVKVVPSNIARAEYKKEYYQNQLVKKQVEATFNAMMANSGGQGFDVVYNEITQDATGGVDAKYNQTKKITNIDDFIDYGLAQGKIEKTQSINMSGGVNVSVGGKNNPNGGTANLQPDAFNVKYTNIKGEENIMSLPFDVYPLAQWSTNSNTSKLVPVQNNLIPNDAQRFNVVDNEKTGGQDITVENPKGGAAYNVTLGRAGVIDVLGKKVNTITIIASTGDKINTSGEIEQRGITTEWGLDPIKNKKYIIDTFGQDAYDDAMSVFKTGNAPSNSGSGNKPRTQQNNNTAKKPKPY